MSTRLSFVKQNGTHSNTNSLSALLNAPPGVPPPANAYAAQLSSGPTPGPITNATAAPGSAPALYASNGLAPGDSHTNPSESHPNPQNAVSNPNPNSLPANSTSLQQHPQTPAEQILMSAADRWGLLSLITMMKSANSDVDHGLTTIGTDLGTMGLDMGYAG